MKKVLLIIFTLLILTTNLCAWDDTDREIGIWIDQIREYQRDNYIKFISKNEFFKLFKILECIPSDPSKIMLFNK